jgi:hypothetical protein
MRIENYQFPKSSFLSVDKDMMIISEWILKNDRLKKLLHYTTRDAMKKNNLTEDESYALFNKNIKMVPKLYIDGSVLNYIIIGFDNFVENANNPEFRDNIISFDIICHFDQWQLEDFELRPYRIAAEIDSMFNDKHLTGIGKLQFLGANQIVINDEFAGLTLMYSAIHGGEDKVGMPNPANNAQFEQDFDKLFNN